MAYKIYYTLKPFIPRRLLIELRRRRALRLRARCADIWPIDEKAGKPPLGWTGWPEGKKFALVLTHDVDTAEGQERCSDLMKLEKKLGFRSSFNFVARRYSVSSELRRRLVQNGFEVGVHGLYHDGKYYVNRKGFEERAVLINEYLREWGAVGFRSPSMQHNLEWIHDLNIEYDASTFDTDPFEPQPAGMGTIFPFWLKGNGGQKGYVELPYTLPQDFTLFIIMREQNIDIWKKKLDWIVNCGGMVLLNTHPDYMHFEEGQKGKETYSASNYEEFLTYLKTCYKDQYWHCLPSEMARFWSGSYAGKDQRRRGKIHACMLSYSFYERDGRVRRYAESLADRGDEVDVIAIKEKGQPDFEIIKGVKVYRIQERARDEKGKFDYLVRLVKFLVKSSLFLSRLHHKKPYQVIHVHSVPDFEVFATLLSKLRGARIILDIHDIVPEFYASKFKGGSGSFIFKLLVAIERASIAFADHVIISNHLWQKTLLSRSVENGKCSVILNYPDESVFSKSGKRRNKEKLVMIYPGTLNWHQGLDIAIKAFSQIAEKVPNAEFHIYGSGNAKDELAELVDSLGLKNRVRLNDSVPIDQIADIMATADIGIVPKRNDPFGGEAFSTKILEFMVLGVPVIVSGTKIDRYYFNDSVVKFFEAENIDDLADCMLRLIEDKNARESLAERAEKFVADYVWDKNKDNYFALVDGLIGRN